MKKLMHKITLGISILLLASSFQASAKRKPVEKSKSVKEKYSISKEHNIFIANKFGKVNVTHWNEQAIDLDIKIVVKHSNDNKAQEILDKIEIDIKKTDNEIRIYTRIKGDKNIELNSKRNSDISIDYDLRLPQENSLNIKNSFGEVVLESRSGNTEVDLNFGSATIGDLSGERSVLKFMFSDPVVVNSIGSGEILLKHSKLELLRAKKLELRSEMSSSKVDRVEDADVHLQFGSVQVNEINNLILESQMSSVEVDKLNLEGSIKNNYGSLSINQISQKIKVLDILAEFSPVTIQLEKAGNYLLDAETKMGELKLPANSIQEERRYVEEKSVIKMNKDFKGRIGQKSDNAGKIKIRNSFGEIKVTLTD